MLAAKAEKNAQRTENSAIIMDFMPGNYIFVSEKANFGGFRQEKRPTDNSCPRPAPASPHRKPEEQALKKIFLPQKF